MAGCLYERVVHDGWADLRQMADPPAKSGRDRVAGPSSERRVSRWAIELEKYEGPDCYRQAFARLQALQERARMPDLWVHGTGATAHVYRGQYDRPHDPRVERDLRHSRSVRLDGKQPFAAAALVPVGADPADPMDLRRYPGAYSLQIAVYDQAFGAGFRQAAQKAAQVLRDEGEEAYFYHGPHRSMVTLGLFTDADFVQQGPYRVYGPRILELQEKYPFNLSNGVTMIDKIKGKSIGAQPSFLVRVN